MKKGKMKLHIFNPEHDIALAHNDKFFTAPKVARNLHDDCAFLPALWAEEGDYVLVKDKIVAVEKLSKTNVRSNKVNFITSSELHTLPDDSIVDPWGWDSALCFQLRKSGLPSRNIPDDNELECIRNLSSRRFSSEVLKQLREEADFNSTFTIGKANYISDIKQLITSVNEYSKAVLKEPWSCSGRGVRYVSSSNEEDSETKFEYLTEPTINWAKNIIQRQGGIMIEPYYNNVFDFGMEFFSDNDGVHYCGLSVFNTENGFYIGNIVASEEYKEELISRLITIDRLSVVRKSIESILSEKMKGHYNGPLGVDMMIVKTDKGSFRLHPLVEINVRRTMGHVALDIFGKIPFGRATICLSKGTCIVESID